MDKIAAFAKKYKRIARAAERSDSLVLVQVDPAELTAHASVNKSLIQAARHAMNGERGHVDALIQDARNEFAKIRDAAKLAMRSRI